MNAFNLSVRAKLFATLALVSVVMIVVGVMGLSGAWSSNKDLDAIFSNRFMPTGWVGTIESLEREILAKAEDAVIRQDAAAVKEALDLVKEREDVVKDLQGRLQATELTDDERGIADEFGKHAIDVLTFVEQALTAAQAGTFDKAESLLIEKARPAYEQVMGSSGSLLETQIDVAQTMREEAETAFKRDKCDY